MRTFFFGGSASRLEWVYGVCFVRVLGFLLGCLFVYAAIFLYEDEENKIQDRVETWWLTLTEAEAHSRKRVTLFANGVARLTGSFLDSLFGKPLNFLQVAGVSFCFSVASFAFSGLIGSALARWIKGPSISHPFQTVRWGAGFVVLALLPSIFNRKWMIRLWWVVVVAQALPIGSFLLFLLSSRGQAFAFRAAWYLLAIFATSFTSDFAYIALSRWMLRQMESDRVSRTLLLLVCNLAALAMLIQFPLYIGSKVSKLDPDLEVALMFSVPLNLIDFLVGSAWLAIIFLLLLHQLLWPAIQRPLYAAQRFEVFRQKKILWTTGLSLIGLSTGGGWLLSTLKKFF